MEQSNVFPTGNYENVKKQNIQIQTYGQRLFRDQTFYEYLLEFLLVFISEKGTESSKTKDRGFSFPTQFKRRKNCLLSISTNGLKKIYFFK